MAALRKTFLALTAIAVVTTTATSVFAQTQPSVPQASSCSIQGVPTLMRYQGLTEYIGDIVVTCVGGTPVLAGVQVPTVNFQVDLLNQTNFTSRLLDGNNLPAQNGGFPYNEAILAINEPVPTQGENNPANAGQSSPYGVIRQSICPASNTTGQCLNKGTGNGGWGNGSAGSSYDPSNPSETADHGNYNVFQGYLHTGGSTPSSNKEVRFDGIPYDPPGSTGTIEFRITNLRIDATYFSAAGPGIQVPVYATVTITGTQPPAVNGSNSPLVGYATNGIVAPPPTEVRSLICGDAQDFVVPIQEGFASSFKRRTWFTNNFTSPDPTPLYGSGTGNTVGGTFTKYSTQNVFSYGYFTESNWFANWPDEQSALIDYGAVGLATNGTRLYVTLTNINPGVTVTAPAYAGLFGGTPLASSVPGVYNPYPNAPSGILYLVGKSPSYPIDYSGYLNTNNPAVALSYTAPAGLKPGSITFVYEVLTSDPAYIETALIDFGTGYTPGLATPIPPWVLSSSVGFAPNPTDLSTGMPLQPPTVGDSPGGRPAGVEAYPRFVPGSGPAQADWYLSPCQCDLLFPFAVSNSEFETGIAIDNTSSDPYNTNRAPGYVQLFYYLANMAKKGNLCPTCPVGNDGTRSDFQQTTTNWIAPGDEFLYVVGSGSSTTTGANPGTGANTPIGTVGADPGVLGVPGFEGYIFAVTTFQYCHGYAFIQTRDNSLAEGYLPLVVDEGDKLHRGHGSDGGWGSNPSGPGNLPIYSPNVVDRNAYNN